MHNEFRALIRAVGPCLMAIALIACNGASNTVADATSAAPGPGASAPPPAVAVTPPPHAPPVTAQAAMPVISGTPSSKAVVGQQFSFQPSASDGNGGRLTFAIASKPQWTSFDSTTGHLWGTPRQADIGAHER